MELVAVNFENLPFKFPPPLVLNGVPLFDKESALELINLCEQYSVVILGIEGFYIKGITREPIMECIADFSSIIERRNESITSTTRAAKEFVNANWRQCQMMEFVFAKYISEVY